MTRPSPVRAVACAAVRAAAAGRMVHVGRELRGVTAPWIPWTLSIAVSWAVGFGLTTCSGVPGDASRLEPSVIQVALADSVPAEPGRTSYAC